MKRTTKPIASGYLAVDDATGESDTQKGIKTNSSNVTKDKATRDYETALRLYEENAHVFVEAVEHLRGLASDGKHVGSAELAAYLRGHDFTNSEGGEFKTNNSYIAAWIRFLADDYPDLAPHIELRGSRFDRFFEKEGE